MAYFLFVDESGQDLTSSIVEVLAGIVVADEDLWNLIIELKQWELACFGVKYPKEIKASRFLTTSVFKKANRLPLLESQERVELVKQCFELGAAAKEKHIVAVEQSKISYVSGVLEICHRYRCKVFATINRNKIYRHKLEEEYQSFLPKSYIYLFERFYYFLDERQYQNSGILVFDELDKSECHILIHQIEQYFKSTVKGRQRSNLIIPAPFFVHSDLTTIIQVADLVAYIISWGFRLKKSGPVREELAAMVEQIKVMRYRTVRETTELDNREVWSIVEV